jgi:DNA-binding response OmpR family regulator
VRILLAEDDEMLAQLVAELLTEEGHRVTRVRSAEEARIFARSGPWGAVLVDSFSESYQAPISADYALLRELSAAAPVVVVTARAWAARLTAADLGVAALVQKPFDIQHLLDTLRVLSGRNS